MHNYVSVGDSVPAKILSLDIENNNIDLSLKACKDDPFEKIKENYKMHGEYVGTITGVKSYGAFVNIAQGVSALCPQPKWINFIPAVGDTLLIRIKRINTEERKIDATLIRRIRRA